jgi:hypothetical protein
MLIPSRPARRILAYSSTLNMLGLASLLAESKQAYETTGRVGPFSMPISVPRWVPFRCRLPDQSQNNGGNMQEPVLPMAATRPEATSERKTRCDL